MSALTLGLIAAIAWGFHDICIRWLSQTVPLLASLLAVLLAGLGFHLGIMAVTGGFAPVAGVSLVYALASGVTFLVASLGLYGAFQRGPVRLVAPIIASYPILSVCFAALRGAEVSPMQWGAVLAVVLGVSIVTALADTSTEEVPPVGLTVIYSAVSAVGFAATFALGELAIAGAHEMSVTLVTRVVAIGGVACVIMIARVPMWTGLRPLPVLALMGLADAVALACMMWANTLADVQYAAVAASCFGLLTIVLAWAFLGEKMRAGQWAGCAVTFAAIAYLAL